MKLYRNVVLGAMCIGGAMFGAQAFAQSKLNCGLSNGKKAGGEPIQIGAIVGKSGPDDFSASASAASAYFKCVNENGGINGRPIEYTVLDDQWNPEMAAQAAAKLVKDRKVVAMVGSSSFVECGANAKMYAQEGVVSLAGVGVPRECFSAENYVPVNTGPRISATIAAMYAKEKYGSKKMACLIPNIPSLGNWACDGVKDWGKLNGVEVDVILVDPGSPDPTSTMLLAASKKPDTIVLNLPKGIMLPMLAAAEQQGLSKKMRFVSSTPAYNFDVPKAAGAAWNKNFDLHLEFMPVSSAGADNQNWKGVMDAYAAKTDPRDSFAQAGYLSARIATEALLKMDAKTIDRAGVTKAIKAVSGFKSDIMCSPFYVGNGKKHNANNSGPIAQIDGASFTQTTAKCMKSADPELADIYAAEKKMKF